MVYLTLYIVTTLWLSFKSWQKKIKTDSFDLFHYNTDAWSYLQITCNKLIPKSAFSYAFLTIKQNWRFKLIFDLWSKNSP